MRVLPRAGYFGRMRIYFDEMFPLARHATLALLLAGGWLGLLGHLHDRPIDLLSLPAGIGAFSVFALSLILRLMDEHKDVDVDSALFRHRPVPSGRVHLEDLGFTLRLVIGLFLAAHIIFLPGILWMAGALLAYALLMFAFFFAPALLRRNLLLALATHNPVVSVLLVYLVVLYAHAAHLPLRQVAWTPVLLLTGFYWLLLLSWEVSRKIRVPEDEDDYVTYSRLFGTAGAVGLAAALQTAALAMAVVVAHTHGLPHPFVPIVAAGYAVALCGHARFLLRPATRTARLRPFAEAYILIACAAALPAAAGM